MRIYQLSIRHFRGIRELDWNVSGGTHCLVGPGDVGKSTVLDALELALSPRVSNFITDADFHRCDPTSALSIEVTVGGLPEKLLTEEKFGYYKRGWTKDGKIRDEPADDDTEVLTVRLTCDASLAPEWMVVTDRQEPKHFSSRDRDHLPLLRVGATVDRVFTWGRGTVLSRMVEDPRAAAPILSSASRQMRAAVGSVPLEGFSEVAAKVRAAAATLGANVGTSAAAGLDPELVQLGVGAIALHFNCVPARLSGLGTKRLTAMALQLVDDSAAKDAVLLVDEVEHALDTARLLRLLEALVGHRSKVDTKPQVLMSTHSSVVLQELPSRYFSVMRRADGNATIQSVGSADGMQALVRRAPAALLSRRVLVCEGKTEVGLCRALETSLEAKIQVNFAAQGIAVVDGGGNPGAVQRAIEFLSLGYDVAVLLDSDKAPPELETAQFSVGGGTMFVWHGGLCTEERVFTDLPPAHVERAVALAGEKFELTGIMQSVNDRLTNKPSLPLPKTFEFGAWVQRAASEADLRAAIGKAAAKNDWFKNIDFGEQLGAIVIEALDEVPQSELAKSVGKLKEWVGV